VKCLRSPPFMPYFAWFDLFSGNPCLRKLNHSQELLPDAIVVGNFICIAETKQLYLCSSSACISHFHPSGIFT